MLVAGNTENLEKCSRIRRDWQCPQRLVINNKLRWLAEKFFLPPPEARPRGPENVAIGLDSMGGED